MKFKDVLDDVLVVLFGTLLATFLYIVMFIVFPSLSEISQNILTC